MLDQSQNQQTDNQKPKILILPYPEYKIDTTLAILALTQLYEGSHQIEVLTANSMPQKFSRALSQKNTKLVENLPEQKFLLQFKRQQNKIKSIQWNQNEDNVNLYVTMAGGIFNERDFEFSYMGAVYEKIFLVGIASFQELKNFNAETYKYIFEKSEIVALGKEFKEPFDNLSLAYDVENSGISEDLYDYIEKTEIELTPHTANSILAGIHFATNNFKEQIKSPKTFQVAGKLMEKGAKPAEAINILSNFE